MQTKHIYLAIYSVVFSVVIVLIIMKAHSLTSMSFYVVGNETNAPLNNCSEISVTAKDNLDVPLKFSGKTLYVNPNLFSEIKMPEKYANMYNVSRPPTLYSFNISRENIVFIGDSYTAGAAVKFNETFPYYLSKEMNYNIINLGIGGYNTKQEVERLKKIGLKYKPKIVVIQSCKNDWEDGEELWSYIRNASVMLNHYGYDCVKDPLSSGSPVFMKLIDLYYKTTLDKKQEYFEKDVIAPLSELNNISKSKDIPIIFVLLPSSKNQEGVLIPLIKRYGWNLIYLRNETDFHGWKPPYTVSKENAHFSPQTHKLVSKLLKERLDTMLK